MSNTKMLIDATHPEETRVVVQRNGRVEEFDFESAARKLLRGNIYLAKVTRVEPSLQAAFVDYGGNRHGFLAFNEIHPDYYQIPVADRQALIDEEAAAEAELEAAADRRAEALARRSAMRHPSAAPDFSDAGVKDAEGDQYEPAGEGDAPNIVDVEEDEHIEEVGGDATATPAMTVAASHAISIDDVASEPVADDSDDAETSAESPELGGGINEPHSSHHEAEDDEGQDDDEPSGDADQPGEAHADEHLHGEHEGSARGEFAEDAPSRPRRRPRSYKIQEVIKRRQIILVQIVKEERGNKGAALTTYLSLAGRYTVLMPNTARGGGISRKITNPQDRKRLKAIAQELEVPEGMGLIIRTAGAARTKQEIKRDFEYLLRLWESVRELTLQSTAPSLVYEEGDLVKRSIRDLYNKDVEEVVVAGAAGHQEAADFMRMLMPSHSKNVIEYKDPTPLFTKYGVERQLNAMFLPQVTLRSGGYIVINQTEALVAIDVNSGKSTREFSIEETALATNLEASDEIARQLKLRDLAGLIVIDFIDMEEKRNNRAVERRLKDALRFDRARIQLGRISHFGLMEMSRQRLRTGVLEGSTSQCPHCQGTGIIRSTESIALAVLRGLEDAITAGGSAPLIATTTPTVALYILNSKRAYVTDMEVRHGHAVTILGSDRVQGANFTIERGAASATTARRPERAAVNMNWGFEGEGEDEAPSFEAVQIEIVGENDYRAGGDGAEPRARDGEEDFARREGGSRRGRRRGRGRGGRGEDGRRAEFDGDRGSRSHSAGSDRGVAERDEVSSPTDAGNDDESASDELSAIEGAERPEAGEAAAGDRPGRRRRRGRRGGRRGRDGAERGEQSDGTAPVNADAPDGDDIGAEVDTDTASQKIVPNEQPSRRSPRDFDRPRPERARPERIWDTPSPRANGESVRAYEAPDNAAATAPPPRVVEADAPAPTRRHEVGSSEPRIERVVVRPDQPSDDPNDAPAAPQRKGWWQRRFGAD
ncbi:MAG: Rne/Rng family ribonuclease [Hyphomicrobium sp.]